MKRKLPPALAGAVIAAATLWLLGPGAGARVAADANSAAAASEPVLNYEQSNGKKVFERYCAVCHGAAGEGDGFNAFNLNPKPKNLADREAMHRFSGQQLFDAISQGGAERGKSNLMPAWGHTLNDRQMRYLVAYIRTLGESK